MPQVYSKDDDGFYIEPVLLDDGVDLPDYCVEDMPREGLYRARRNSDNTGWEEGASPEEIAGIINSQPIQPTDEQLKLQALEKENTLLKAQIQAASDRADFQEELIVEMAMILYS